jgi:hypothetical protein
VLNLHGPLDRRAWQVPLAVLPASALVSQKRPFAHGFPLSQTAPATPGVGGATQVFEEASQTRPVAQRTSSSALQG